MTQPRLEVRGDSLTYVGLGIGALGLVVTVVGLGEKVTIGEIHPYTVLLLVGSARPCQTDTAQGIKIPKLALRCVFMVEEWLPCTERLFYRRWRQQCNDPTHNRFFLCITVGDTISLVHSRFR